MCDFQTLVHCLVCLQVQGLSTEQLKTAVTRSLPELAADEDVFPWKKIKICAGRLSAEARPLPFHLRFLESILCCLFRHSSC